MIRIEEISVRLGIQAVAFVCTVAGRMAARENRPPCRLTMLAGTKKGRAVARPSSPARTRAQARRGARSLTQNRRRGKGRAAPGAAGRAVMLELLASRRS